MPSETSNSLNIFVTVGTDLPFDRLIHAIDEWYENNRFHNVYAQIGETKLIPKFLDYSKFIDPTEYKRRILESDYIISHAGMGTILTALQHQKPLLVMPRRASLGEHRNEHQLATANHLATLNKVDVASDEIELIKQLSDISSLKVRSKIGPFASESLLKKISGFIETACPSEK